MTMDRIRRAESPLKAMKSGQDRSLDVREDWDLVKIDVMKKALFAKFEHNRRLKKMLLETGEEPLIHASQSDAFWGQSNEGVGENKLGELIMLVRNLL